MTHVRIIVLKIRACPNYQRRAKIRTAPRKKYNGVRQGVALPRGCRLQGVLRLRSLATRYADVPWYTILTH